MQNIPGLWTALACVYFYMFTLFQNTLLLVALPPYLAVPVCTTFLALPAFTTLYLATLGSLALPTGCSFLALCTGCSYLRLKNARSSQTCLVARAVLVWTAVTAVSEPKGWVRMHWATSSWLALIVPGTLLPYWPVTHTSPPHTALAPPAVLVLAALLTPPALASYTTAATRHAHQSTTIHHIEND